MHREGLRADRILELFDQFEDRGERVVQKDGIDQETGALDLQQRLDVCDPILYHNNRLLRGGKRRRPCSEFHSPLHHVRHRSTSDFKRSVNS